MTVLVTTMFCQNLDRKMLLLNALRGLRNVRHDALKSAILQKQGWSPVGQL
jgi:hypothetical protein